MEPTCEQINKIRYYYLLVDEIITNHTEPYRFSIVHQETYLALQNSSPTDD